MGRTIALALCVGCAAAFTAAPGPRLARNSPTRSLRAGAGVCQLQCAAGSDDASVLRVGRKHMLQGAMSLIVVTAFGGEASAKKQKEKPCQPGLCVKASSPGIALDMIILMKSAKAMREAGEQVRLLQTRCLARGFPRAHHTDTSLPLHPMRSSSLASTRRWTRG